MPLLTTPLITPIVAPAGFAAFNAAAMPLNFFITTPFVDGLPLTCGGTLPLGCL
jgi:hypothetical protein